MTKYIINIAVLLFDRISMLIFQLWMTSFFVKELGLSGYGQWSYSLNIITIIISIFILGIDVIIIKDIVRNKNRTEECISSGILIQLTGLILVTLTSVKLLNTSDELILYSLISIVLANFFIILSKLFFWNYAALVESKYRTLSTLISFLMFVPCVYSYLNWIESNELVVFVYAIYYSVQFIVSFFVYKFLFNGKFKFILKKIRFMEYSRVGASLIISTLSVMIFTQTDVIMIKYFLGDVVTGEFSAAIKISTSVFIFAGVLANTFYPMIIKLKNSERYEFIRFSIATVTFFSILSSTIITISSSFIIEALYGTNQNITQILSFHIWCSIFIFSGAFTSRYLYARELYKIEIIKTVLAAIMNVLLNLYLIPNYGAVGAVFSSLLAYMFANYFSLYLFKESRNMFFIQSKSFLLIINPRKYLVKMKEVKCLFQ